MDELPPTAVVRLERRGTHLIATFDDPGTRNALTDEAAADLRTIIALVEADRSFRSLVLRGANDTFCTGANLKGSVADQSQPGASSADPIRDLSIRMGELLHALSRCPLAVVAVVEGPAFGGGFGLACCADIILVTPAARFALSETSLGLPPAQIAPYVHDRLGLKTAMRLALTGERIDGAKALAIELADEISDAPEEMLARTLDMIGRCAPEANAATKRLFLNLGAKGSLYFCEQAADMFTAALRGPEGREGVAAFGEKRRPSWVATVQ